jgi:hypothetical protein
MSKSVTHVSVMDLDFESTAKLSRQENRGSHLVRQINRRPSLNIVR